MTEPPRSSLTPVRSGLQYLPRYEGYRGGRASVSLRPHPTDDGPGDAATTRCRQCHVLVLDPGLFVENSFQGLRQDLRSGSRLYGGAPPTIPHKILMREKCAACHTGPGARVEIVTSHPERTRCRQCHVPVTTRDGYPQLYPDPPPTTTGGIMSEMSDVIHLDAEEEAERLWQGAKQAQDAAGTIL